MAEEQEKKVEGGKPEEAAVKTEESTDKTPEEPAKEMRAIVLTGFGGLKYVKAAKKPEPTVAEGEILIRVKSCGLSFQDLMTRQGSITTPKTPFTLGFECAGEVEAVGENVTKFKVGDRVVALPELGAWAELVAVPAKYAFPIPAKVSFADAVAITLNYTVAYILLFELAGLTPGKNLLVHSVAGGVGQAIAQLSKTVKDVHVFGVASKDKHEAIQSSVNTLIERGADYSAEVKKISEGGVDFVLDCLCGEDVSKGYNLLKPLGKYILYGSANSVTGETKSLFTAARSWWQVEKFTPTKLFEDNKSVSGFNLRHLLHQQNGSAYIAGIVEKVFALFKDGKIKPIVDSTWALEDVPEAMQKLHDRKNVGKVILDPSLEPKPKPATPAKSKGKDKEEKKKEDKEKNKDKDKDKDKEKEKEKEKEKDKDADKNGSSNPPAEEKSKENAS
ncbi:synaptic vesicle membrane protein VAT-1 homolog-like isoform X2 [Bemisia tabaci]|uniref:synaptic vesicle membrane protein VAT-1 homolog-like isoform X2 n=1 Tax=Bemisia tabaci TaxID=7038 RepID=UPI0008F9C096|nr:PREDICTED: synaptic vesicle membrane protein VAT-1 homolog-like isoform X2 [Bemisia tabaci]